MVGLRGPEQSSVSRSTVDQARRVTELAAGRAGVVVEVVEDVAVLQEAVELLCAVWGVDRREPPIRRDMLRALTHAGNYVATAAANGRLVGVVIGFLGRHQGELVLHSHILGVIESMQGRSVGFALKQHQRWWSLAQGLEHVTWTFDPLVRRNANFNLNKLRARIVAYHPSFYGPMDDGINAGDETDRCVVWWPLLDGPVVQAAADGHERALNGPPPGCAVVLEADAGNWPHLKGVGAGTELRPEVLAAWVPADIVQLRREEPSKALAWRRALRAALSGALAEGYGIVGVTRGGWYLLEPAGTPR